MALSQTETYEFSVGEVPTIDVRHAAGRLTISAGEAGAAHVIVTKKVRDVLGGLFGGHHEISEEELASIPVSVTQEGNTIRIKSGDRREFSLLRFVTIDITVIVPPTSDLRLNMSAGKTEVTGVAGRIDAEINAGSFEAERTTFTADSRIAVNAGSVLAQSSLGEGASLDVDVNAGSARLELPPATAVTLDARAQAGSLRVDGWPIHVMKRAAEQRASGPLAPNPRGVLRVRVNAGSALIQAR